MGGWNAANQQRLQMLAYSIVYRSVGVGAFYWNSRRSRRRIYAYGCAHVCMCSLMYCNSTSLWYVDGKRAFNCAQMNIRLQSLLTIRNKWKVSALCRFY